MTGETTLIGVRIERSERYGRVFKMGVKVEEKEGYGVGWGGGRGTGAGRGSSPCCGVGVVLRGWVGGWLGMG